MKFQENLWAQSFADLRRLIFPLLIVGFGISLVQLAQHLKLLAFLGNWRDFFYEGAVWASWIIIGYVIQRNVLANRQAEFDLPKARIATGIKYFCVVGLIVLVSSIPTQLVYSLLFQASLHAAAHLAMGGMGGGGMMMGAHLLAGIVFLICFTVTAGFFGAFLPHLVLDAKIPLLPALRRSCSAWGYVAPRLAGLVISFVIVRFSATLFFLWALQPTPIYKPFGLDIAWQGLLIANIQLFIKAYLVILLINVCTRAYFLNEQHQKNSVSIEEDNQKLITP
ncbi:hypothetical protein ACTU44_16185 [Thalassospira sp. SM2505]